MGFFDKLKKKKAPVAKPADTFYTKEWLALFSACLGRMMVMQQNAYEHIIKDQDWNVDLSEGSITFGSNKYPVQFIGSESDISNTWMWGWNNVNNFPDHVLDLAYEMLETGNELELDPFRLAQFELDEVFNGQSLSIVACGISKNEYFYFRCPHSNGAALLAVGNLPKEVFTSVGAIEFANLTMQCVQQYYIDHKFFVESLLKWNETAFEWNGDVLTAHFDQELNITFEQSGEQYRIINMNIR